METNQTLLTSAGGINKDALVGIFDLYSPALFNYALRLSGNPGLADDIVGDVFANLLDQLSTGQGPTSNLRSYLFEIAYHRIVDEARYSRRRVSLEAVAFLRQDPYSAVLQVENHILYKQILDIMRNELTSDQQHVIVLRFLEEFSLNETAAIMGKTVSHVKVIQNRAITALRRALEYRAVKKVMSAPRIRNLSRVFGI